MAELLPIKDIIVDPDIQSRVEISKETLQEYAVMIAEGTEFTAVTVFDTDEGYLLADGFHRIEAHKLASKRKILAEVKEGTRRDALLYSLGANARHGQRMTHADKNKVVRRLLTDPEWSQWSDNEIARKVGVTQPFVTGLRTKIVEETGIEAPTVRKATRKGKTYEVNVAPIAATPKTRKESPTILELLEAEPKPEIKPKPDPVEDVNEIEVVEIEVSAKLGNSWKIDSHALYFNTLSKVIKKIGEFNHCLYFGPVKDAIKDAAVLFEKCDSITLVIDDGESIFDALTEIDLPYQKGNLVGVGDKPYYLAHYGESEIDLEDFSTNNLTIFIEEIVNGCTVEEDKVLIIDPPKEILPTMHKWNRTCVIVSSEIDYVTAELKSLPRWGLEAVSQ